MFFYDFTHKELNQEMNEFIKKLKEAEALPPDAPSWAQFLINAYRAARKKVFNINYLQNEIFVSNFRSASFLLI